MTEGYKCKSYVPGPDIGWHMGGAWCKFSNTPAKCYRCPFFDEKED